MPNKKDLCHDHQRTTRAMSQSRSLQRCAALAGCRLCQLFRIIEEIKRRACLFGRVGWKGKGRASSSISGSNRGTFSPQGSCREEPWHTQSQNVDKVALVRTIRSPVGLARLSLSSTRTACGQMMHHAVIFRGENQFLLQVALCFSKCPCRPSSPSIYQFKCCKLIMCHCALYCFLNYFDTYICSIVSKPSELPHSKGHFSLLHAEVMNFLWFIQESADILVVGGRHGAENKGTFYYFFFFFKLGYSCLKDFEKEDKATFSHV